jgi:hypothetical protein
MNIFFDSVHLLFMYKFKWLVDIVLRKPVVSVIPLNGTIMAGKGALGRPVINMDNTRAADISRIDFSWELFLTRGSICFRIPSCTFGQIWIQNAELFLDSDDPAPASRALSSKSLWKNYNLRKYFL